LDAGLGAKEIRRPRGRGFGKGGISRNPKNIGGEESDRPRRKVNRKGRGRGKASGEAPEEKN